MEEEVPQLPASQSEPEEAHSDFEDEKAKKKKPSKTKKIYLPKVVKVNAEEEREPIERRKVNPPLQNSKQNKLKEELSKYIAPIATASNAINPANVFAKSIEKSQTVQSEKLTWFTQEPYRIGSIFRHFVEKGKMFYVLNIEHRNGDLACVTKVAC